MPQPRRVHDLTRELLAFYQRAWNAITTEQQAIANSWGELNRIRRLERLRTLQRTVEDLMDTADEHAASFVNDQLPRAYLYGVAASGIGRVTLMQPDLDALGVLSQDTYDGLLSATTFVRDSTKDLIRTLSREHVADKLLEGKTATQAARELRDTFASRGVAAVVYSDGSRHGLEEYANVVVRTKTAEAYNTGNFTRFVAGGVGFVECFDNPECGLDGHDDEEKPNGQVYPVAVMDEFSISHPNCVRAWGARPDITNETEAADAAGTATVVQNEDQAQVAVSRQEASIARSFGRRTGAGLSDVGQRAAAAPHAAVLSRRAATLTRRETLIARSAATPARVAADLVAKATAAEPELTRLASSLAEQHGGQMAGLDFRLKTEGSLARKIAADVQAKGMTAAEVGDSLFDVNRYTAVFPADEYASSSQAVLDDLRGSGHTVNVKNYWNNRDNPYQGINVQVTSPAGQRWELQFHTETSLEVKEGDLHAIYEKARVTTDEQLLRTYTAESFAASAAIPVPFGVQSVG